MNKHEHYTAQLASGSVMPTLLCGHCNSILSKGRIFANESDNRHDLACRTIGLCSADDCGAVNCCDDAMRDLKNEQQYRKAAG